MILTNLTVDNFRNLIDVDLAFSSSINIFYGCNGSGKTSILEAIHYLGLGRSFRSRNVRRLINHTSDKFALVGQLFQVNQPTITVGIERKADSSLIKIGGKASGSLVELAQLLPLQLINADSHLLLTSGPLARRQFIDWGSFHVEPLFFSYWQRANRIIKQRNANLKSARNYSDVSMWDEELETIAIWLAQQRENYINQFQPIFTTLLESLLDREDLKLHYYRGWSNESLYKDLLRASFARDQLLGYTQFGPHRADLQLKFKNVAAVEVLSQGQQKLAAYAMRIAQGLHLRQQSTKRCIFLIDDLPSELDQERRLKIIELLLCLDSQLFVTGIEIESLLQLATNQAKVFHVEQGSIKES